jgi:pyruvate,water dikinase
MRPRIEQFCGRTYTTGERRSTTGELDDLQRGSTARVRADARGGRARWDQEHRPAVYAHYAWMEERTRAIPSLPRTELAPLWDEVWRRYGEIWVMHMLTVWAAFAGGDELSEFYEQVVGGKALDALRLTQGRAHSLQQLERELESLAALRATGDERALSQAAEAFVGSPHGNLGSTGEDPRRPTWRDDPGLLLAELDRRVASPRETAESRHARLMAESDAVEARTREVLRDRPNDLARFEELLALARAVAPLSEEHNYHLDRQVQPTMRRLFIAIGARMAADRQLDASEDVYHLSAAEVGEALRDGGSRHESVRAGANDYASWRRLRHPTTIGAPPAPSHSMSTRTDLNLRTTQDDTGVIRGVPASGGLRRGRVRVVRGSNEFARLKPGEVLVCRSSNVSWIPLFTIAVAVVTDVGGSLSHAAVVAREFGVPAVVGCGVATNTLRDGQLVEVDGDRGTIRLLDGV